MKLRGIQDIDIAGKTVFIRCDFNVPQDEYGNITDDRRIRSTLPTINYCIDNDCKIILASHLGRPKGKPDEKYSIKPIAKRLKTLLKREIIVAKNVIGEDACQKVANLKAWDILLLENLRFEPGEEKNDLEFAKALASFADVYINDAFGASHRAHASVEAMPTLFPDGAKAAGFLLQKEIEFFQSTVENPERPFVAIVGGSKVSGKLEALQHLLPKVDKLIIGGGMAFTFLRALGEDVGNSLVEEELIPAAMEIMKECKQSKKKLYLPVDVIIADKFAEDAHVAHCTAKEIPEGWMGLDIGPATVELFSQALENARTILWNGPMGVFEMEKFQKGSFRISHKIASLEDAIKIVGGGDTADLVQKAGDAEHMSFISTGGGASLELLEGKVLPGVKALAIGE
ncbi:MAG: phosphoglycerate kinase [Campylobacterales bacterium]